MGSKGRFVLLGLLLILGVLCRSGHSLECYSCINPVISCDINMTCSYNFDACILVKAEVGRHYYQCWRMEHCEWDYISSALGETKLTYECCQKDLCNTEKEESDTSHLSGRTTLLATPLLAAAWSLCL
uniref:CD59 glycoprotein n=1 Tax=Equus asinus TaxID=9793 RepID=A0A9L0I8S1_EQUAS|nr:CD59 glycoprotein [Equus asinus]